MESQTRLSPMPPVPSFPTSPAGTRKRSIHEVDEDIVPSPNAKRPLTESAGENQENRDPSIPPPADNAGSTSQSPKSMMTPSRSVEVVASNPEPDMPASKKRKVASAGQDAKQQEKEAKERQKAEEKLKKEEEKVKREEEKAKKEEEKRTKAEEKKKRDTEREEEKRKKEAHREEERKQRDEKKKAKEDEKAAKEAAKEEEKRKKDEEKEKKTRSQMKLNSFFAKPPLPSAPAGHVTAVPSSPRKSSITEVPEDSPRGLQSDYEREFPPFFLKSHTVVAPPHRFERDPEALAHVRQIVDSSLNKTPADEVLPFRPSELFQLIPFHRRHSDPTKTVRNIVMQIHKSEESSHPDQDSSLGSSPSPQDMLRKVTMKSLKFGEDIRPPYQGTYTRPVSKLSARKLSRNPYYRGLPETNYDYDSEAEWEEPEEGEELDSEEEDEGSDEGEDDLDGFLDDEDDALAGGKRRPIVGDLEPVTTGIQWAADGVNPETRVYQIQTISDAVKFPIDPFSTAYWEKPKPKPVEQSSKAHATAGEIFRFPAFPGAPTAGAVPPYKAKRPFPPDQLAEFKEAVEGSDLSKIGLVEILKKRFPKVSKETLKATLDQVAVRVGQKEVDKKWVCR